MINEYFESLMHSIIHISLNTESLNIESISDIADIVLSVLTGVIAIIGISYIKPLKDKTISATFTFWSQLKIRLIPIKARLEADNDILSNIYNDDDDESLHPKKDRITELKTDIQNTLEYIKNTPDQMPAYRGWSVDYAKLILLLEDCLVYDIENGESYFKNIIHDSTNKNYQEEICKTIDKIICGIDERQKKIEKKILKYPF